MKNKLLLCILLSFTTWVTSAQDKLSLSFGLDLPFSAGSDYKFTENGNVLRRGGTGYYESNVAFYTQLRYKFNRYVGIMANYNLVEYDLGVHDSKYLSRNNLSGPPAKNTTKSSTDAQPGYLGAYKYYSSTGLSLMGYIPLSYNMYEDVATSIYFSGGLLHNQRNGEGVYQNSYSSGNETLLLITHYSPFFITQCYEVGVNHSSYGFVYNLGFKYVHGPTMMHAEYSNVDNGKLINADKVSASSSYFAVTFNVGFTLFQEKKISFKMTPERPIENNKPVTVDDNIVKGAGKDVNDRPVEVASTLTIQSNNDSVVLEIWDDGTVDGDAISLNLNGEWILIDYTLVNQKYSIPVVLKPGENKLIVYTENEGRIKPCTVAIEVKDSSGTQYKLLRSSLKKSSCLVLNNIK